MSEAHPGCGIITGAVYFPAIQSSSLDDSAVIGAATTELPHPLLSRRTLELHKLKLGAPSRRQTMATVGVITLVQDSSGTLLCTYICSLFWMFHKGLIRIDHCLGGYIGQEELGDL